MLFRPLVLSFVFVPAMVSASDAFELNDQGSTMKGAATSAQAANAELAAVLKKKTKAGNHIKVADAKGEHVGELIKVMDNAIDMDEETQTEYVPLTIPFENVETVWKRTSSSRQGAFIGLAVGTAVGLVLGIAASSDPFFESDAGTVTLASALGLGAVGAGLGALVGLGSHSYRIIYQRP